MLDSVSIWGFEMSPEALHSLALVALIALNSFLSRFLPFVIFAKSTPSVIVRLGKVLPSAIIAMLIVYCLRNTDLLHAPFGLNEIIAIAVVALTHIVCNIAVLSIVLGTFTYMALVQSEVLLLIL